MTFRAFLQVSAAALSLAAATGGPLRAQPGGVRLVRGPYLQVSGKTAITIRWRTDVPAASCVAIGTDPAARSRVVQDTLAGVEHVVRVAGLQPDTRYYYAIGTAAGWLQGDAGNFFTTAPEDACTHTITIAALGDCGRNDNGYQSGALRAYQDYLAAHGQKAADLLLLLGDNAYYAGTDPEYTANFFEPYAGLLRNHPLFPCPGNHDYANDPARQADHRVPYYSHFSMPAHGECGGVASGTPAYYSFDRGNVHFIALDSYGLEDSGTTSLYDTAGAQVRWLKADLAANPKRWTIAYWHHPPYTMGNHNSDDEAALVQIRTHLIRILERHGVDLILCAHSHDYERSYLMKGHYGNEASFSRDRHAVDSSCGRYDGTPNSCPYTTSSGHEAHGTVYVVAGSAGADGNVQAGWPHDALPFSQHDGGLFLLEVEDNRLDAKFLRRDGAIADRFTILKDVNRRDTLQVAPGQAVTLRASWPGRYHWQPDGTDDRSYRLTPGCNTVVWVRDDEHHSCLADRFFIRTGPDSSAPPTAPDAADAVYPLPAPETLHLRLHAPAADTYAFRTYDAQGRLLQATAQPLAAGEQDVTIDVRHLPAGQPLLLRVSAPGYQQTFRFTHSP